MSKNDTKEPHMQIVPYQPAHLPGLYTIYRQATANIPHCRFIPSQTYTGQALARAEQAGDGLLVAEDQGAAQGIVMFRPVAPGRDDVPQLEITGLFAPDEATVALLITACFSRAEGAQRIVAFPAEEFRLEWLVRPDAIRRARARASRIRTYLPRTPPRMYCAALSTPTSACAARHHAG